MKKMATTTRKGKRAAGGGQQQDQEEGEEEEEETITTAEEGENTKKSSRVAMKKGPWSSAEDLVLVAYVRENGEGNWNAVHARTGLRRCGKSCRLRWANHLRPNLKKGPITLPEERAIVSLHARFGNKWAKMAQLIPGRTDNEIKNFWNTRCKRLLRQQQQQQQPGCGTPTPPASQFLVPPLPPSLPLPSREFRGQNEVYLVSLMAGATGIKSPTHNAMIMNRDFLLDNVDGCRLVVDAPSPLPLETQWELPSRQIEMPASDLNHDYNGRHLLASSSSSSSVSSYYYEAENNNVVASLDCTHSVSLPALESEEEKQASEHYVNPLAFLGGRSLTLLDEENEDACSALFWAQPESNQVWHPPPEEANANATSYANANVNANAVNRELLQWNYPLLRPMLQPCSNRYEPCTETFEVPGQAATSLYDSDNGERGFPDTWLW